MQLTNLSEIGVVAEGYESELLKIKVDQQGCITTIDLKRSYSAQKSGS